MPKVFKYPVKIDDYIDMLLPSGAKILRFDIQDGNLVVWALVNLDKPLVTRRFRMSGTGREIKESIENLIYINTFYSHNNTLVWHLFEII